VARASKASAASKKSASAKKSAAKKATGSARSAASKAAKAPATRTSANASGKRTATSSNAAAKSQATRAATSSKAPAKRAAKAPEKAEKKAAGGRKKSSAFDSKFLERMRKLLHVERDTYERQAKQLRAEADSLVMDLDPGDVQFDEESGEGDTIAVERGRDLALAAKALEMIEEIDHALAKFDLGTYGICEVSGEPIPEERLEAIPWAREKVEYKVGGFGRR
jgi:RNA polymerase-binding transcription factor DksA